MDEDKKALRQVSTHHGRRFVVLAAFVGCALALTSCGGGNTTKSPVLRVASRTATATTVIAIEVQPGVDVSVIARQYSAVIKGGSRGKDLYRLVIPADDYTRVVTAMRTDPRILFVEPDDILITPETDGSVEGNPIHVPFDFSTSFSVNAYSDTFASLTNTTVNQEAYQQINLSDVPDVTRGAGVTVAVLDTGVQADHPDLASHLVPGFNALTPESVPDDIPDGANNVVLGHGTMVTGIIARLAPEAKILPIRVLDADGRGSLVGTVLGIRHAVEQGAKVLNLSLGTPVYSAMMEDAISDARAAGCIVVAAAGNSNTFLPQYPAAFPGVLAVVAVDGRNQKASFSNYGTYVTIAAPGIGIRSTFVGSGYASWSGTSFAAPFVAAAAALTLSAHPDWTGPKVTQRLWQTAQSINSANTTLSGQLGKGILNINSAVK